MPVFKGIDISNHFIKTTWPKQLTCPKNLNNFAEHSSLPNLSVTLSHFESDKDFKEKFTQFFKRDDHQVNIGTVYLGNCFGSYNSTLWDKTIDLLMNEKIKIGCSLNYDSRSYARINEFDRWLSKNLLNKEKYVTLLSSEMKLKIEIYPSVIENLTDILYSLDKAVTKFPDRYLGTELVPEIVLKDFPTSDGDIYCNPDEILLNEYYNSILTFASIYNWTKLYLRPAAFDQEIVYEQISPWWWNIQTDSDFVDRHKTNFPLLVRTNSAKSIKTVDEIAMTYDCIQRTGTPLASGIPFLDNQQSGTTIYLDIKKQVSLRPVELETLLLFAFSKFNLVELIVKTKNDFDVVSTVILNERFLKTVRQINGTILYLEIPIELDLSSELLLNLPDDSAVHISGWEDNMNNNSDSEINLNFVELLHKQRKQVGLLVESCEMETSTNFSMLLKLPQLSKLSYIICDTKPAEFSNFGSRSGKYFNTLFYMKTYMENFLRKYTKLAETFQVVFRLNNVSPSICQLGQRNVKFTYDLFLGFLSDLNQHSNAYNMTYFVVKGFHHEYIKDPCYFAWWELKNYSDLSNISVYVDREEGKNNKFVIKYLNTILVLEN